MTKIDPTGLAAFYENPTHATLARVTPMWQRTLIEQAFSSLPFRARLVEHFSLFDRTYVLVARYRDDGTGTVLNYATFRVCPLPRVALGEPRVSLESGHYGLKTLSLAAQNLEDRLVAEVAR